MDLKKPATLRHRLQESIVDTVLSSTSHGVPNIIRSKNVYIKIMWIIFTILSSSACSLLIIQSISNFFKFEVTTKTRVINEYMSLFPTITVCNINFFTSDFSALFIDKFHSYLNSDLNLVKDPLSIYFEAIAKMNFKQDEYKNYLDKFGDSNDKLIVNCYFNYDSCKKIEFSYFFHPIYGNCYQFNAGFDLSGNKTDIKSSMMIERLAGLRLILNISVSDKLKFMNPSAGAVVFIHNQTDYPMMANPITLAPQTETSIGLSRNFYKSEPKPYSNCDGKTDDINSHDSEYYKLVHKHANVYSQTLCSYQCVQKFFIDRCDCYMPEYPCFFKSKPCDPIAWNKCISVEFKNIQLGNYLVNECEKKCPLECEGMWFDKTVSSNKFSNSFYEEYVQQYNGSDQIYFNKSFDGRDLAVVNIHYEKLGYKLVTESPSTDVVGLLSNIGGVGGLFLGVSLLTFVEIIEILVKIIIVISDRKKSKISA